MSAAIAVLRAYVLCVIFIDTESETLISDACHGAPHVNQNYNILKCAELIRILISEVRYYQWHDDDGCYHSIADVVDKYCCLHNNTRCYWTDETEKDTLQGECDSKPVGMNCVLYAGGIRLIKLPCTQDNGALPVSSVRSIRYTCEQETTVINPSTPDKDTSSTSSTKSSNTDAAIDTSVAPTHITDGIIKTSSEITLLGGGEIAGIVSGGVILVCVCFAGILCLILKLRVKTKAGKSNEHVIDKAGGHGRGHTDTSSRSVYINNGQLVADEEPHDYENTGSNPIQPDYVTMIQDNKDSDQAVYYNTSPKIDFLHLVNSGIVTNTGLYEHLSRQEVQAGNAAYEILNRPR